jgi:hypothetical protein
MPDVQFGFRRSRLTLQATRNLLNDIEEALRLPGGKFFMVFMDFSKASDMLNRMKLMTKLKHIIGPDHAMTRILRDILALAMSKPMRSLPSRKTLHRPVESLRVTLSVPPIQYCYHKCSKSKTARLQKTKLYICR